MKIISILLILAVLVVPAIAAKPDLSIFYVDDNGMATCAMPQEASVDQKLQWTFTSAVTGECTESYIQKTELSVNRMNGVSREYGYRTNIVTDAPGSTTTFDSAVMANVTPMQTSLTGAHSISSKNGIGSQSVSTRITGGNMTSEDYAPFDEQIMSGQSFNMDESVDLAVTVTSLDGATGIPLNIESVAEVNGFRATYFDSGKVSQADAAALKSNSSDTTAYHDTSSWSNSRNILKQGKTSSVFKYSSKHGSAAA